MKKITDYTPTVYELVSIIRKARKDSLTPVESQTLQEWLDRDVKNRELYERLLCEDQSEKVESMVSMDASAPYFRMINVQRKKKKTQWLVAGGISVAASIMLYFLFVPLSPDTTMETRGSLSLLSKEASDLITLQTGPMQKDLIVQEDSVYEVSSLVRAARLESPVVRGQDKPVVIHTPIGKTISFRMYDGSTVYLNSNSTITFYNHDVRNNERRVKLNGEAFFVVSKDKDRPFVVENHGNEIKVLGTSFNVNGYDNRPKFKLGLATGKVEVNFKEVGQSETLTPGNEFIYDRGQKIVTRHMVDTDRIGLWRTGVYAFEKATIQELTKDLEQMYPIHFKYEGDIPKYRFSGEISRKENWQKALEKLEMTHRVKFIIEGDEITVQSH